MTTDKHETSRDLAFSRAGVLLGRLIELSQHLDARCELSYEEKTEAFVLKFRTTLFGADYAQQYCFGGKILAMAVDLQLPINELEAHWRRTQASIKAIIEKEADAQRA